MYLPAIHVLQVDITKYMWAFCMIGWEIPTSLRVYQILSNGTINKFSLDFKASRPETRIFHENYVNHLAADVLGPNVIGTLLLEDNDYFIFPHKNQWQIPTQLSYSRKHGWKIYICLRLNCFQPNFDWYPALCSVWTQLVRGRNIYLEMPYIIPVVHSAIRYDIHGDCISSQWCIYFGIVMVTTMRLA